MRGARYFLLNKPYGVLCQFTDPAGRPTLADWFPVAAMYAAGRLDTDSEGLLLLTNDGDLIHRLAQPEGKQPKTYLAQVERAAESAPGRCHRGPAHATGAGGIARRSADLVGTPRTDSFSAIGANGLAAHGAHRRT